MGEVQILTKRQQDILDLVAGSTTLASSFYFSGGTALSAFYLQHRESIDLDFFSEKRFDTQTILTNFKKWEEELGFELQSEFLDPLFRCQAVFKNGEKVKIDFSYYPYKRLDKGTRLKLLEVDSLLDIAVNKLMTITQRHEVKDFVDLYFLLQRFSVWELKEGVRVKFRNDLEPFVIASDLTIVEEFEFLPKMTKPLTLEELKAFFVEQAKALGIKSVE